MIWWPKLSRVREVSCGPARTTMETSNQILLLKVGVVEDDKLVVAISLINDHVCRRGERELQLDRHDQMSNTWIHLIAACCMMWRV